MEKTQAGKPDRRRAGKPDRRHAGPPRPDGNGKRQPSPERRGSGGRPGERPDSPGRRPASPGRRQPSPERRGSGGRPGEQPDSPGRRPASPGRRQPGIPAGKQAGTTAKRSAKPKSATAATEPVRLNRYIANSGLCARREADELIKMGYITVNGVRVTDMGIRVKPSDTIEYKGRKLKPENKVYILMNKPRGYVTTVKDPHAEATVLDLVNDASGERIYPVGRLDKSTTGVLLLTNDGDLAGKLTHPKYGARKVYHVFTDRDVTKHDMETIVNGVDLEDGTVSADAISYVDPEDKTQVGIEIHSGQNRVVRRIFEKLGYRVRKLDRVSFAGLTKKNVPRGTWRYLTAKELSMLKRGIFK